MLDMFVRSVPTVAETSKEIRKTKRESKHFHYAYLWLNSPIQKKGTFKASVIVLSQEPPNRASLLVENISIMPLENGPQVALERNSSGLTIFSLSISFFVSLSFLSFKCTFLSILPLTLWFLGQPP